ncbi:MAG: glycosyltransferase family 4 protein [Phycisphaerae bacterium]|nr:glycosyltransferase family 4 protein [Phycisphaerae bacterium]
MKIAIFDYKTTRTNPIGSCHHRMIESLCRDHEFTVFATEFDNPDPTRIRFVRVIVPKRPLAVLFIAYHIVAPICFFWNWLKRRERFDLIQMVESNCFVGRDVDYVQFVHRRFLRQWWPLVKGKGLRSHLRFLDHWVHARFEPWVYAGARVIVVPSKGTAREVSEEYPSVASKVRVLHNPVDLAKYSRPVDFDRVGTRGKLRINPEDVLMVFAALGHFERKGLPLIMEAMKQLRRPELKLIVVGGERDLVETYRERTHGMELDGQIQFLGMQSDIRPHLYAADAFVFPSSYEAFSLVTLQAAAAGLPSIVTPLNGVEEFTIDGKNGLIIERSDAGVRAGIERFLSLTPDQRVLMGRSARQDVSVFAADIFDQKWRDLYAEMGTRNR